MKDPQDLEKMITLYLYDELSPAEKREFERHLAADDESRAYFERRKQQHELLRGQPVAEPTDERLLELRLALRRRLQNQREVGSARQRRWLGRQLPLRMAVLVTCGVALFLFGIGFGRFVWPPAEARVQFEDDRIANVDLVEFEPKSGLVTIHYETMQAVALHGSLDDARIRSVLAHTIRRDENPGTRLAAVRASVGNVAYDQNLQLALIEAMQQDSVPGVRLRAGKALRQLPMNADIQSAFIRVLLKDNNPAMRILAVEALAERLRKEVVPVLQNAARSDENEFVRLLTTRALQSGKETRM